MKPRRDPLRLLVPILGIPFLSSGAEKTFTWTGGLDSWDNGTRWQTIDGTGEVPGNTDHTVMVGENANGRVLLNSGISRFAGRVWIGTFRFTASPTAFVLDDFQPVPGLLETYASFSATHDLTGLADDDDDKDGTKNFAEYAFGTSPKGMSFPPAAVGETIDGPKWLVIRYVRRAAHTLAGLNIVAEQCSNFATWTTSGVIDEPDPDAISPAPNTDARRARIPKETGLAFIRLRATTP